MVSEEIHHLEEVGRFATAVGQRKQGAWIKWESAKDRAVTWWDLKHMEPKKLSFLIKAVYDVLPTPVNLHAWGLTTSDRCRACGKTASLKHILTGCEYALRSYTWRHNEVLEIFFWGFKNMLWDCQWSSKYYQQQSNSYFKHTHIHPPTHTHIYKWSKFGNQLRASYVSSHTEELRYNETVCLWRTIYVVFWPSIRPNLPFQGDAPEGSDTF